MAEQARMKLRSFLVTLLGILIAIYVPCTWVLFDRGGRAGPPPIGFAEMPIYLANMVVMLIARPTPLPPALLAALVVAFVMALTYFGRTGGMRRIVAISFAFISSCLLSFAAFMLCHGHS